MAGRRRIPEILNDPAATASEIQDIFERVKIAPGSFAQFANIPGKYFPYPCIRFPIQISMYAISQPGGRDRNIPGFLAGPPFAKLRNQELVSKPDVLKGRICHVDWLDRS
jgi:hypothetical protein